MELEQTAFPDGPMGRHLRGKDVSQSPMLASSSLRNIPDLPWQVHRHFPFLLPLQDWLTCFPSPEWLKFVNEQGGSCEWKLKQNKKPTPNKQALRWILTSKKPPVTLVLEASLSVQTQLFSKVLFNHDLLTTRIFPVGRILSLFSSLRRKSHSILQLWTDFSENLQRFSAFYLLLELL